MSDKRVRSIRKGWWDVRRLICCAAAVLWAVPGYADTPAEKTPERFPVVVKVDFGPAKKPAHEQRMMVDEGSTAKDVVSLLFPIQSGATCCNTRELAAIDGIWADPAQNTWWTCRINGSTKIGPFLTELHAGDHVEWVYVKQAQ
jgi:hypothetical protein